MNQEQDIAEWLIAHKETLKEEIAKRSLPNTLLPSDVYRDILEQQILEFLKEQIEQHFSLTPEELALTMQAHWVKIILDA